MRPGRKNDKNSSELEQTAHQITNRDRTVGLFILGTLHLNRHQVLHSIIARSRTGHIKQARLHPARQGCPAKLVGVHSRLIYLAPGRLLGRLRNIPFPSGAFQDSATSGGRRKINFVRVNPCPS